MAEFAIIIPSDPKLRDSVRSALASDASVGFTESEYCDLMESEGAGMTVTAYLFNAATAAALVAMLRYASPILVEYIRRKYVYIKVDGVEIKVASAADLNLAVEAAKKLAKSQSAQNQKRGPTPRIETDTKGCGPP